MVLFFFGERWNAQMFREQPYQRVTTPVGEPCIFCREPIEDGDRGLMRPVVTVLEEAAAGPLHLECDLRMALGSVAHLTSQCICCGVQQEKPFPGTPRQEALAVLAIINDERTAAGQPSL